MCTACGTPQGKQLDKALLLVITFFLGAVGGHKFYTERYWQGVLYFIFAWTLIPGLIAFVEFIIYAATDLAQLREKFPRTNGIGVIIVMVVCVMMFFITGIMAAIAIPQFVKYRERSYDMQVTVALERVKTAENLYRMEYGHYTDDIDQLEMGFIHPDILIAIMSVNNGKCFQATASHSKRGRTRTIDCHGNISEVP